MCSTCPAVTVIHQCALTKDLALFDAGDETQVGEKGITLRYVDAASFHRQDLPTFPSTAEAKR